MLVQNNGKLDQVIDIAIVYLWWGFNMFGIYK